MTDIQVNGRKFKLKQCEVMRFEDEFGHSYEIDGEPVAGVTTLLSLGTPIESGLLEYFKRTDKDTQEDILNDAQQRGSNVHKAIEDLLNGISVPSAVFSRRREKLAIEAFVAWFEATKPEDVLSEQVVAYKSGERSLCHNAPVKVVGGGDFNDQDRAITMHYECTECDQSCDLQGEIKFAGTLDFIGTINGKRILIDFKTGSFASKKDKLQVQAYKKCVEQSTDEKIDACYVLYLGTSHKGTRATKDENGLLNNGPGWSLVRSDLTFENFMQAYDMAILMNDGYPKPPKVVAFPEQWRILEGASASKPNTTQGGSE